MDLSQMRATFWWSSHSFYLSNCTSATMRHGMKPTQIVNRNHWGAFFHGDKRSCPISKRSTATNSIPHMYLAICTTCRNWQNGTSTQKMKRPSWDDIRISLHSFQAPTNDLKTRCWSVAKHTADWLQDTSAKISNALIATSIAMG